MRTALLLAALWVAGGAPTGAGRALAAEPAAPDSAAADTLGEAAAPADTAGDAAEEAAATARPAVAADAPADTSLRVPGCHLRFGWSLARAQTLLPLAIARGGARGEVAREGKLAWYGVESEVTLHFRRDRLARVHVVVKQPNARARDYVEDSMLREGFRRACTQRDALGRVCTWTADAKVDLRNMPERMDAMITPAPPPPPRPVVVTPPREVPMFGEILVFGRPPAAGAMPAPAVAYRPVPALPPAARAAGVQGNVWVRAMVDTSGAVMDAAIVRGIPELDSAALVAAREWRFERFAPGGVPHRARIEFPVRFLLR